MFHQKTLKTEKNDKLLVLVIHTSFWKKLKNYQNLQNQMTSYLQRVEVMNGTYRKEHLII